MKGVDADQSFGHPPGFAADNYSVEISDDDVELLKLHDSNDAKVVCIATYHPNETVTVVERTFTTNTPEKPGKSFRLTPVNCRCLIQWETNSDLLKE